MGLAFDLRTRQVQGRPVVLLEGIRARPEGAVDFSFSQNGTLAYIPARSSTDSALVWVDREGRSKPLTGARRPFSAPRLAPDGERVAVTLGDTARGDIWIYREDDLVPLTSVGSNTFPVWTRDGEHLSFASNRAGPWNIFWTPGDGSGEPERLLPGPENQIPGSWSPHGVLAYTRGKGVGRDIWVLPLRGDRQPREFFATPFIERNPMFSPDGRWIALVSLRTGRAEIYVKPYPGPGEAVQISADGGNEPRWSPDGRELFYRNGKRMMAVAIQTEPTFSPASPRPLFEADYAQNHVGSLSNYDVDGQGRFLMVLEEEPPGSQIQVIFNWFEQLKRLVPNR